MSCKLGHRVGRVVIIEATNAIGRPDVGNMMRMAVVLGERNKRTNGMNTSVVCNKLRVFRFGNKGPSSVQSCRTESTSEDGGTP